MKHEFKLIATLFSRCIRFWIYRSFVQFRWCFDTLNARHGFICIWFILRAKFRSMTLTGRFDCCGLVSRFAKKVDQRTQLFCCRKFCFCLLSGRVSLTKLNTKKYCRCREKSLRQFHYWANWHQCRWFGCRWRVCVFGRVHHFFNPTFSSCFFFFCWHHDVTQIIISFASADHFSFTSLNCVDAPVHCALAVLLQIKPNFLSVFLFFRSLRRRWNFLATCKRWKHVSQFAKCNRKRWAKTTDRERESVVAQRAERTTDRWVKMWRQTSFRVSDAVWSHLNVVAVAVAVAFVSVVVHFCFFFLAFIRCREHLSTGCLFTCSVVHVSA